MDGWIKIHRKMVDWEWFDDHKTLVLFMYLIMTCNYKPTKWRGIQVEVGESIKSIESLAKATKLSERKIRSAIENLKVTGEVTQRRHGKHRILKLKNFSRYQISDRKTDSKSDIKMTADKEIKETKENTILVRTSVSNELAQLLLKLILNNNPNYRYDKKTIERWDIEIDRMIRIDKRKPQEIQLVIRWCQQDSFWKANILSASKLRKQYDQLYAKCGSYLSKNNTSVTI